MTQMMISHLLDVGMTRWTAEDQHTMHRRLVQNEKRKICLCLLLVDGEDIETIQTMMMRMRRTMMAICLLHDNDNAHLHHQHHLRHHPLVGAQHQRKKERDDEEEDTRAMTMMCHLFVVLAMIKEEEEEEEETDQGAKQVCVRLMSFGSSWRMHAAMISRD